jgi:hypothetical protein
MVACLRKRDVDARRARVSEWLKNMKLLVEESKLPLKQAGSRRPPISTDACRAMRSLNLMIGARVGLSYNGM